MPSMTRTTLVGTIVPHLAKCSMKDGTKCLRLWAKACSQLWSERETRKRTTKKLRSKSRGLKRRCELVFQISLVTITKLVTSDLQVQGWPQRSSNFETNHRGRSRGQTARRPTLERLCTSQSPLHGLRILKVGFSLTTTRKPLKAIAHTHAA